jgi:thiol:disulfide interchange protein
MRTISFRQSFAIAMLALAGILAPQLGQDARAQFQLPGLTDLGQDADPFFVTAQFSAPQGNAPGRLFVTAKIEEPWHVFSVTQAAGGPVPTKITLAKDQPAALAGSFASIPAPEIHEEPIWNGLEVETQVGLVTWYAPLAITAGTDLNTLQLRGTVVMQACKEGECRPPKPVAFVATLGSGVAVPAAAPASAQATKPKPPASGMLGRAAATSSASEITPLKTNASVRVQVDSSDARPGGKVRLSVTVTPKPGFHIYPLAPESTSKFGKPTVFSLSSTSGLSVLGASADRPPVKKASDVEPGGVVSYYEKPVTFTVDLAVPAGATPGEHSIKGILGLQTCDDKHCDPPGGVEFALAVPVSSQKPVKIELKPGRYIDALKPAAPTAFNAASVVLKDDVAQMPAWTAILFGFIGGFILNFMPCVLPVIGLKILSFVEQSGHSRSRVFMLNVVYTIGLLSVFMLLAALAVFFGFGWGRLAGYAQFNIILAAIIFVMSLSFLGVWEIPIPGFVGTGKANELAAHEGYAGAFFKGVITTILATPCTAPFLGSALAWSAAQPPVLVFALFACIGLGMASPYLVIGAMPGLIRLLPRPGMWMDTFKQTMGFVLLATVIYLLSVLKPALVLPTVALLFGLWAACWWIGRTPLTASFGPKLLAWAQAGIYSALLIIALFWGFDRLSDGRIPVGSFASVMSSRFDFDVDNIMAQRLREQTSRPQVAEEHATNELPWEPFSEARLIELTGQGKTVFVDFTARWCLLCKTLEKTVLNTEPTRQKVAENHVVTLVADYTDLSEEITKMLDVLGSQGIPLWVIFPAGRANEPIVLRDNFTHQALFDAFAKAGPSRSVDASRGAVSAK